MSSRNQKIAYICLFGSTLIWGATVPLMKYTLEYIPVFVLAFVRFFGAAILLFPFVYKDLRIKISDIPLFILAGLFGISFHIAAFFYGLTYTFAVNASILAASAPLFTIVLAGILLHEKISRRMIVGASIGLLGILIITVQNFQGGFAISPIGDLLIIVSALSFVLFEIISKKLDTRYSPLVINFYSFLIGSFTFSPIALQYFLENPRLLFEIPSTAQLGLIYGVVFSSFAAYALWQKGLAGLDASKVGLFMYLDPLVATSIAVIVLGEQISPYFIGGAVCIFLGILVARSHIHHFRSHGPRRSHT